MQIESIRMHNKFSYHINVDETIDQHNTLVPPFILQPFVENSIWHGLAKKDSPGTIQIKISKEGEMLTCIIDDDGVGRNQNKDQEDHHHQKSMGVKITRSRIEMMNKLKGVSGSIQMLDKSKGLCVKVTLPVELQF